MLGRYREMSATASFTLSEADSKSAGAIGTRAERATALSATFESIAHACPERWILPPIQKIVAGYEASRRTDACSDPSRSTPLLSPSTHLRLAGL
jgi:hypothetical protein